MTRVVVSEQTTQFPRRSNFPDSSKGDVCLPLVPRQLHQQMGGRNANLNASTLTIFLNPIPAGSLKLFQFSFHIEASVCPLVSSSHDIEGDSGCDWVKSESDMIITR